MINDKNWQLMTIPNGRIVRVSYMGWWGKKKGWHMCKDLLCAGTIKCFIDILPFKLDSVLWAIVSGGTEAQRG